MSELARAMAVPSRLNRLHQFVVTAEQMRQIESRVFAAGMPVAALMEKVGGLLTQWIQTQFPQVQRVGILVGPGHNGGDGLVVARELSLSGYEVIRYQPVSTLKDLTQTHADYADSLGIPVSDQVDGLQDCDLLIDALFGFGLTRPLEGAIAEAIQHINQGSQPVVSIDLPSGMHTDTGEALGATIAATHTLCLGLWKRACLQDRALADLGKATLIDFGLPLTDIEAILGTPAQLQRLTPELTLAALPLPRPAVTHKYQQGHLLLVCGSRQYMGAAILAGCAARASGVGMLSIAVPETLRSVLIAQLPEALVIGCPETETGAIAALPDVELSRYQSIACGPGITLQALPVVQQILKCDCPLLLDADGLNGLATLGTLPTLQTRTAATILTPHFGEFKRLFPELAASNSDRITLTQAAAAQSGAIVLLKGARTAIADPSGRVDLIPDSSPALARGGSGDVLTGLLGGLLAQAGGRELRTVVSSGAWWHARAGLLAAETYTELGVDASRLIGCLAPMLAGCLNHPLGRPTEARSALGAGVYSNER